MFHSALALNTMVNEFARCHNGHFAAYDVGVRLESWLLKWQRVYIRDTFVFVLSDYIKVVGFTYRVVLLNEIQLYDLLLLN